MDTNKAVYWIALGVLALGLNSEYHRGNLVGMHRLADRAGSVMCRISTRAERTFAVATNLTRRSPVAVDDLLASTGSVDAVREQAESLREQARDQRELLRDRVREAIRAQADAMRAQAEVRRAVMEQVQVRTRSQIRLASTTGRAMTVICPKTRVGIVMPGPDGTELSPDFEVEVDDSF